MIECSYCDWPDMDGPTVKLMPKRPSILKAIKAERAQVALLEQQAQRAIKALQVAQAPQE